MKDPDSINEIVGITFFSDFFNLPNRERMIPTADNIIVIESPIKLPMFAILVGCTNTIKKQVIPSASEM